MLMRSYSGSYDSEPRQEILARAWFGKLLRVRLNSESFAIANISEPRHSVANILGDLLSKIESPLHLDFELLRVIEETCEEQISIDLTFKNVSRETIQLAFERFQHEDTQHVRDVSMIDEYGGQIPFTVDLQAKETVITYTISKTMNPNDVYRVYLRYRATQGLTHKAGRFWFTSGVFRNFDRMYETMNYRVTLKLPRFKSKEFWQSVRVYGLDAVPEEDPSSGRIRLRWERTLTLYERIHFGCVFFLSMRQSIPGLALTGLGALITAIIQFLVPRVFPLLIGRS